MEPLKAGPHNFAERSVQNVPTTFTVLSTAPASIKPMASGLRATRSFTSASESITLGGTPLPVKIRRDQYAFICASSLSITLVINSIRVDLPDGSAMARHPTRHVSVGIRALGRCTFAGNDQARPICFHLRLILGDRLGNKF